MCLRHLNKCWVGDTHSLWVLLITYSEERMDPDGDGTLRALWSLCHQQPPRSPRSPAGAQAGLRLLLACKQGELCRAGGPAHLPCPWCPRESWQGAPCPWERPCCTSPPILPGKEKPFPGAEEPPSFWEESSDRPGRRVSSFSSQLAL